MLRDEVEALDRPPVPPRRRRARSRRDPGAVRAAEGSRRARRHRRRRRLEPARRAPFRQFRLPPRHPRRRRLPPPGRDPQRLRASMPASSATAPTPSCSSASATPICCSSSARGSARRPPTATRWSRPTIPARRWSTSTPTPTSSAASITPICRSAPTWASSPRWSTNGAIPSWSASRAGEEAHRGMARLVGAQAAQGRQARPRPVRQGDARGASGRHHRLQRRGQFLRLVAPLLALRLRADPARADQRHDGLRPPRRGRRGAALQGPAGGLRRRRRRFPDERAGTGDRRRNTAPTCWSSWSTMAATAPSACTRSATIRSGSARPT